MLALQLLGLAPLVPELLLGVLGLALLEVLDGLDDVVLHDGDALDFLDLAAFLADDDAGEDGDQTAQHDEQCRAPRRPVEAVEVPHEHAQAHLEHRVEHVHVHDKVQGPGFRGRRADSRQGRRRHGCRGERDGGIGFQFGDLRFRVWRWGFGSLWILLAVDGWRAHALVEFVASRESIPTPIDACKPTVVLVFTENPPLHEVVEIPGSPGQQTIRSDAEEAVEDL